MTDQHPPGPFHDIGDPATQARAQFAESVEAIGAALYPLLHGSILDINRALHQATITLTAGTAFRHVLDGDETLAGAALDELHPAGLHAVFAATQLLGQLALDRTPEGRAATAEFTGPSAARIKADMDLHAVLRHAMRGEASAAIRAVQALPGEQRDALRHGVSLTAAIIADVESGSVHGGEERP